MLAIASGFAVHQLFETYTLYQFGPGSVLGALAVGYMSRVSLRDLLAIVWTKPRDEQ